MVTYSPAAGTYTAPRSSTSSTLTAKPSLKRGAGLNSRVVRSVFHGRFLQARMARWTG